MGAQAVQQAGRRAQGYVGKTAEAATQAASQVARTAAKAAATVQGEASNKPGVTKRRDFRQSVMASTGALYCGYLDKLSKFGVWQRRFFETSGHYLRYYPDERRSELLAAVDLQVLERHSNCTITH